MFRFSHIEKHLVGYVFRCHPELPAHMVLCQHFQKFLVPVCLHIIKADSGADKYFFNPRNLTQLCQKLQIIPVVRLQIFAGFRKQALPVFADPLSHLLLQAG